MPIYEFYCPGCNTIYQFFSRVMAPGKVPPCPRDGSHELVREVSLFAITGKAKEEPDLPIDEDNLESAMMDLASQAEGLDEENPREAARWMRSFMRKTGMPLGKAMEEALARMEAGEDPDELEEKLGDSLEEEDPFELTPKEILMRAKQMRRIRKDPKLYEM